MRRLLLPAAVLALALAAGIARADTPPNSHDPCIAAGRDTCGTTGVGFYQTYRYGIRWFGDYRGAIANEVHTFCLDLGYWYPSAKYDYQESTPGPLSNRRGGAVSLERQRRMAYAIWTYGRTGNPDEQAAVMLYVHSLMGDARPGEVDPTALNAKVAGFFSKISADAARLHGPYRIVAQLPGKLDVGQSGTATIRVLSASGVALPDIALTIDATGAGGVPKTLTTDGSGLARLTLTATDAAGVHLDVSAAGLASTLPRIFHPTTAAAAPNGQRLAVPASQTVTASAGSKVSKGQLRVSSIAVPASILVGETSRDQITVHGATAGWHGTIDASLFGPFRSVGAIKCNGKPVWTGSVTAPNAGTFLTNPIAFDTPGWYVYRESVPDDASHLGGKTNCTDPLERVEVETQPKLASTVSSPTLNPGAKLSDTITVSDLSGETAFVEASLYGPFESQGQISCSVPPIWTGTLDAKGDGDIKTDPFTLTVPGYYVYREHISAAGFVRSADNACGEASETAIVQASPKVGTQVSAQKTNPGAQITDKVLVTGLGGLSGTVQVELFGPFATSGGIGCAGTPVWTGSIDVKGDGVYTTDTIVLEHAGYYTFRESLAATPAYPAFVGKCRDSAETTLAEATPSLTSTVESDVVRPGTSISDLVTVSGLGQTDARVSVQIFGPFGSRAAIRCTGKPFEQTVITAHGDGDLHTPAVRVSKVGFYAYLERVLGSTTVSSATTDCPDTAETLLAAPQIITGRGDATREIKAQADGPVPTRLQIASLGIDAPISPIGIDMATGTLGVSPDIHRLGWWHDGEAPGAGSGAVLIAGHVDSAKAGAGALFALKTAKAGETVTVTTSDGQTHTYKIVSVKQVLKKDLPLDVYSQKGPPRLVVVTCGGPFDQATGHYLDNIIVTAVPA